jgi:hypothetical protein
VSSVGKTRKPDSSFHAVKEPWKKFEWRIILFCLLDLFVNSPLMVGSSAFSSKTDPFDGGLDRDDRFMVERANRRNYVVYIDRTFWYNAPSGKTARDSAKTRWY